jgi:glycosyltransferase involved in cell wall biosynthesis
MTNNLPSISIIIPCRNEEKFIDKCLDSIITQDYPKEKLEILVIDGMSNDKTREIVKGYSKQHRFIKLLDNSAKIVPTAMNTGIRDAHGEIIIRMDAHNIYEKDYISKCVRYLQEYAVDNVGGIWVTLPGSNTLIAQSIALALSHPFGVGNSYFRIGSKEPKYVDTVPFGCYKREVFQRIGYFNENLVRNQDIEFNLRLKDANGKILLVPDIVSYYHARANLKGLFKQNFWNGYWVIYSLKFARIPFSFRHLIPFAFVLSLFGSLVASAVSKYALFLFILIAVSYGAVNVIFSLKLSRRKSLKYFPTLLLSFATLHISYGLGSLWGAIKLALPHKRMADV